MITPPPYGGHVAVTVRDRSGAGAAMHTVTLAATGVHRTVVTDAQGCALFTYLPAHAYTVSLNSPGYIDRVTPHAEPVGRRRRWSRRPPSRSPSSTTVRRSCGCPRRATGRPRPTGFPALATPASLNYTILNTGLNTLGWTWTPTSTGWTGATVAQPHTTVALFPFADGYRAWVGRCAGANPTGLGDTTPAVVRDDPRPDHRRRRADGDRRGHGATRRRRHRHARERSDRHRLPGQPRRELRRPRRRQRVARRPDHARDLQRQRSDLRAAAIRHLDARRSSTAGPGPAA